MKLNLGVVVPYRNMTQQLIYLLMCFRSHAVRHVMAKIVSSQNFLIGQPASYGEKIMPTLSAKLICGYWQWFGLHRIVQFLETFSNTNYFATLSQQLNRSYFVESLQLDKPRQRDFYAPMYRIEHCTVRAG
jgi:hypothetical protein